jgi:prepilin-type N-terminal cleavage/methylation domain-containing protein
MKIKSISRRPHKAAGFTLVEMIIVIAIITILGSIIIPNTTTMIRDSKIEAANTTAKEIYTATQNYLTDCQIKNVSLTGSDATDDTGALPIVKPSSGSKIIVAMGGTMVDGAKGKARAVCHSADSDTSGANDWCVFDSSAVSGATPLISTITAKDSTGKVYNGCGDKALKGIMKYMGSAMNAQSMGVWVCQIDIETYTVDYVMYSEQLTALSDLGKAVSDSSGTSAKGLYTAIYGSPNNTSERTQENDVYQGTLMYVGQYPIG